MADDRTDDVGDGTAEPDNGSADDESVFDAFDDTAAEIAAGLLLQARAARDGLMSTNSAAAQQAEHIIKIAQMVQETVHRYTTPPDTVGPSSAGATGQAASSPALHGLPPPPSGSPDPHNPSHKG